MVADGVVDLVANLPFDDDLPGPQDRQVLGRISLLDAEFFD
jgi:hypothetical protein